MGVHFLNDQIHMLTVENGEYKSMNCYNVLQEKPLFAFLCMLIFFFSYMCI